MGAIADTLDILLNGSLGVEVSVGGEVVAHASLDLLPMAQGSASVQARLNLTPSQTGMLSISQSSNIALAAHLTQDNADAVSAGVAQAETAQAPTLRMPFHFLTEQEVSESSVACISCMPKTGLPQEFLTAAGSAPEGMHLCLGLMWLDESIAHGIHRRIGQCDGQEFHKIAKCRTLLRSDDFASLQNAAASRGPFYIEISRLDL